MQADVELAHDAGGHRVALSSAWGQKLFLRERTEDLLVGELRARHESRWLPWISTFAEVTGRDRRQRSGQRGYDTLQADAGATLGPFRGLGVVAGVGPRGFLNWPDDRFHHVGLGGFLSAFLRVTGAEAGSVSLGLDGRGFPKGSPAVSITADGQRQFDSSRRRLDGGAWAEGSVESVRALYLRAAYRLTGNGSNSRGEAYLRHRLSLTGGCALPGGVRLLVGGQLQATRWPDGLGLGERLAIQEGDENQSHVVTHLGVPLAGGLWLEARAAAYTAELSAVRTPFLRYTGSVGLGYRW
jgi:hypothetical protein